MATVYGLKIKKIKENIEETEGKIKTDNRKLEAARIVSADAQRMAVSFFCMTVPCTEETNYLPLERRLGPNQSHRTCHQSPPETGDSVADNRQ